MYAYIKSAAVSAAAMLFSVGLSVSGAEAQDAAKYPAKAVRVIVPYAAGGGTDLQARLVADFLSKDLGQPFVIENRDGAATIIGTAAVTKAPADGYTLLVSTDALLVNHWTRSDLTYDTLKDLVTVSMLSTSDSVLAINPSVPAKNLQEFVKYAKENPRKILMGSASLVADLKYRSLGDAAGAEFKVVNYKGASLAMTDLLSGTINAILISMPNVRQDVQLGNLRGLAITGNTRDPSLPDVPTFAEAGLAAFVPTSNINALFAPSGTPKDILEKLNASVRKAQQSPEFIKALADKGFRPVPTTVAEADTIIRRELGEFGKLVKEAGLKPSAN